MESMPSSLQRAVATSKVESRGGTFESSFYGLDLSEFVNTSTPGGSRSQAAASALLVVKQAELQEKRRQEDEEALMKQILFERSKALKDHSVVERTPINVAVPPPSSDPSGVLQLEKGSLAAALVRTHDDDKKYPRMKLKRIKKSKRVSGKGRANIIKSAPWKKKTQKYKYER